MVNKVEDPVGQELGVVGSPTTRPTIAPPNNKAALTPCQALHFSQPQQPTPSLPYLPSPIARKEKTTPRGVRSVVLFVPRTGFEPVLPA